jgi:Kelch motif
VAHTATALSDGRVLATAGYSGNFLASAEIYDPSTGAWSLTGSMATSRQLPKAALLPDGRVLVVARRSRFAKPWTAYSPLMSAVKGWPSGRATGLNALVDHFRVVMASRPPSLDVGSSTWANAFKQRSTS